MKKLTIITATKNSEQRILTLINCLNSINEKLFEWIIVNYQDSSGLKRVISNKYKNKNFYIYDINEEGIYEAINYGILNSENQYYLVVGDDDEIDPYYFDYIFYLINSKEYDCIISPVRYKNSLKIYKKKFSFINGSGVCHTLGMVINKNVHNEIGLYDCSFPHYADQIIMYQLQHNPNTFYTEICSGNFNDAGVSSNIKHSHLVEYRETQIKIFRNKPFYYLLYYIRVFLFNIRRFKLKFTN